MSTGIIYRSVYRKPPVRYARRLINEVVGKTNPQHVGQLRHIEDRVAADVWREEVCREMGELFPCGRQADRECPYGELVQAVNVLFIADAGGWKRAVKRAGIEFYKLYGEDL